MAAVPQLSQMKLGAAFLFAALFLSARALHAEEPQTACFQEPVAVTIDAISNHGDILLVSGQKIRLADIALPETGPWRQNARNALQDLAGQEASASMANTADRWGLQSATIMLGNDDLATRLVLKGLAIVNPGEAAQLCNPSLLSTEQQARKNRSGLWGDPDNQPASAQNPEQLLQRIGLFTLVEGRIHSVGVRQKWTYLNFGRDWKKDFTATISSTVWARIEKRGLTAANLKGKRVLIRGLVRRWNGPSLEIRTPEMIEVRGDVPDGT